MTRVRPVFWKRRLPDGREAVVHDPCPADAHVQIRVGDELKMFPRAEWENLPVVSPIGAALEWFERYRRNN